MKKNILRVENVEKYYGSKGNLTKALAGISFDVSEGEFVGIMGASGSGKTTLLNCIATIDQVTSGHIWIEDANVTTLKSKALSKFRRESLGFIFQDYNLLDPLTAYENIALALTIQSAHHKTIHERILKVSALLGIGDILEKYPTQLSGGQRQRVACARAIVTNPSLVLADEPTGALDSKSARLLLEQMRQINESMNSTMMMVTHDAFAASYCGRILFIKDGKLFNELVKGDQNRKQFLNRIMEVVTLLGGDISHD